MCERARWWGQQREPGGNRWVTERTLSGGNGWQEEPRGFNKGAEGCRPDRRGDGAWGYVWEKHPRDVTVSWTSSHSTHSCRGRLGTEQASVPSDLVTTMLASKIPFSSLPDHSLSAARAVFLTNNSDHVATLEMAGLTGERRVRGTSSGWNEQMNCVLLSASYQEAHDAAVSCNWCR